MGEIDLDAKRAARAAEAEASGKRRTVVAGGQTFDLLLEFPMRVADLWSEGKVHEGLDILLKGHVEELLVSDGFTTADLAVLVDAIRVEYGVAPQGKSKASGSSSPSTGRRSRPTSDASTASA